MSPSEVTFSSDGTHRWASCTIEGAAYYVAAHRCEHGESDEDARAIVLEMARAYVATEMS